MVGRNAHEPPRALPRQQVRNAVHEQERLPVRQDLQHPGLVEGQRLGHDAGTISR